MTLAYLLQTISKNNQMNIWKHIEIIDDTIRIFTTIATFLTSPNNYSLMYNKKVKEWHETENEVIVIL